MAWRTAKVDIDGKSYTVREPSCGAYDRLLSAKDEDARGMYSASVAFVLESLKHAHPDMTEQHLLDAMPPRELDRLVKAIMALSGAEEPAPGERASA